MKVKDLKALYKEEFSNLLTEKYDDYDVLVQMNGQDVVVAPLSMYHADEKLKTVWFAGNPDLKSE